MKSIILLLLLIFILMGLELDCTAQNATLPYADTPFWTGVPDEKTFERIQKDRLAKAQAVLDQILSVKGKRTVANTLQAYDELLLNLDSVDSEGWLVAAVHPDSSLRSAAERARVKADAFSTALMLNQEVYKALGAVELKGADAETRYYLAKTLREFRIAGVEKNAETHQKIKALREELVTLGQEFSRNIQTDSRTVVVNNLSELEGLPQDFIARHKPGADGRITLTIDYADATPVLSYAKNEDLRRRMYMASNNRAYPANMAVLDRMIAKRHELASLLGFASWVDYSTADKMVGNAKNASDFLDRIAEASKARADREYRLLLEYKQRDFPGATSVVGWEASYWSEKVRKSEYDFDTQKFRGYLPYEKVKLGILNVAEKLFGVTFRQIQNAPVWHPSVECWEVLENDKVIGRFYLDMHPRPNKYSHSAHFLIRTGVAGRQLPESVLVCNLPGGIDGDPGLLEFDDVRTSFHEFGHLLHHIFAGNRQWFGTGGIRTELDFQEAPPQMLEECIWDTKTLQTFARHFETGQPIPDNLLKQMKRAREFGKGSYVRSQVIFAKMSLLFHDQNPSKVNTDQITKSLTEEYGLFHFVEGTHYQCKFTHLDNYSALVYTYLWSQVIAKDLFSQFNKTDLLCSEVAKRYRATILNPGGSAPASTLIENFLGRPFNFKAWQDWLDSD